MAWLSSTAWTTSSTPILATVLNNIGLDLRTWGGNVDAGGCDLLNLGGLRVNAGSRVGIGTATPVETVHVKVGANQNLLIQSYSGFTALNAVNDGVSANVPLVLVGSRIEIVATTLGVGTASPTSRLHVMGLSTYASNAAAISAGHTAGAFYADASGNVKVVY